MTGSKALSWSCPASAAMVTVADDLEGDLVDDFGDHRVHLAGHDRRTRLYRRQIDLAEPGGGSGGGQAQVVAGLGELHGDALEDAGELDEGTAVLGGLDEVARGPDGFAADPGEIRAGEFGVAGMAVDAGADRGAAEVGLQQRGGGLGEALAVLLDHDGVGGELLAQRHGDGVLELGAAHLQYVAELRRFRGERRGRRPQGVAEPAQWDDQCQAYGGGVDVVGALVVVDVVERVDHVVGAAGEAEGSQSPVGDDLVGVHVRRGAGPALQKVDDELLVQPPCADLLARADDCPRDVRRQQAEIAVGLRCRLLDRGQRAIRSGNWAMVEPVIAKFSTARTVCTP